MEIHIMEIREAGTQHWDRKRKEAVRNDFFFCFPYSYTYFCQLCYRYLQGSYQEQNRKWHIHKQSAYGYFFDWH